MKKKFCTLFIGTLTLAALFCGTAFAANGSYTVTAELDPDITVKIDGEERTFFNAQGQEVHPISYAGTTYLPLRAIGELMDKNVNWDESTDTATIGGSRVTPDATGQKDRNAREKDVSLSMEPGYTIVIDGVSRTFYDANGKKCDPAVYDGSIYLPIRAIGEIMGKNVAWNSKTETVSLSGQQASGEVTDYDTSSQPNYTNVTTPSGAISLDEAKQTALKHAGKTESQVSFVKGKLEHDDNRWLYDIEFIVQSGSGYTEYDYEIDAFTGDIRSFDQDAEAYNPVNNKGEVSISESRAKEIALAKVPGATTSDIYKFKLDLDDGRYEYEGEIIYKGMEYEFTIDASSGKIVDWESESIYD